jgi:hypothetical protein
MRRIAIVLVVVLASCADRVAPVPTDGPTVVDQSSVDGRPHDIATDLPVGGDVAMDVPADVLTNPPRDARTDLPPDCGGCPDGKLCCASPFMGDIPRCVDPMLNPEHCGSCDSGCNGVCQNGQCGTAVLCNRRRHHCRRRDVPIRSVLLR